MCPHLLKTLIISILLKIPNRMQKTQLLHCGEKGLLQMRR